MKYFVFWALFIALQVPGVVFGQDIGDPAPPLIVSAWIKGGPVTIQPGTNIYVVEIWSSKSVGSRLCVTNLNLAQKRYATNGVVVVGISDEPAVWLTNYLNGEGANIDYAIAADDHRKTGIGFMTPVHQRYIPYAFIVGTNGLVLWRGVPLSGSFNQAMQMIVNGKYDATLAAKREVAAHQMEQYLGLARRGDFRAQAAGDTLLANRTNDVALLCDMAYQIATATGLPKRNLALAGEALDQAETLATTNQATIMSIRAVWLFASGQKAQAVTMAKQALASATSPLVQQNIQSLLQTMQSQMAAEKDHEGKPNQIEGGPTPAPGPTQTNHVGASERSDAPSKS